MTDTPQFTAKDLKKFLEHVPDEAVISIMGDIVAGVELIRGRIREGYYNPGFAKADKGREQAVVFTKYAELSTGEVELLRI